VIVDRTLVFSLLKIVLCWLDEKDVPLEYVPRFLMSDSVLEPLQAAGEIPL
jgi:hypothetical protein